MLLHGSLQRLENLAKLAAFTSKLRGMSHLKFNLGLSNVLLTSASAGHLLRLRNLRPDRLLAEVLQGKTLDGVDAQFRIRLHNGEAARN